MALIDDFKQRFPEFDGGVVDQYFPVVEPVYPCYFGGDVNVPCDKEAALNLIAHLITVNSAPTATAKRAAASKSVGSVSVSYGTSSDTRANADFFNTTRYGQQFLTLTQHNIGGFFV